jgi:hypothetical protein
LNDVSTQQWLDGLSATARLVVERIGSGAAAALSLVLVAVWLVIGFIAGFSDRSRSCSRCPVQSPLSWFSSSSTAPPGTCARF